MPVSRKPYPSDVTDEEWSLVALYLTLMTEDAPQRQHALRELFNGLRYLIRYGIAWRAMPNDLPPWLAVYQRSQRWLAAGVFKALAQDSMTEPDNRPVGIVCQAHGRRVQRAGRSRAPHQSFHEDD